MRISEAELHVMEALWDRHPATSEELAETLLPRQDWQLATLKTLINRLLGKGAIAAEREGRRYLYSPVLQREEWLRSQSQHFLERCFGGRLSALVAHFAEERPLSDEDRRALKALLKEPPRG